MSMKDSVGGQDTGTGQLHTDIEQHRADLGDDVAGSSEKMNPRVRMNRAVGTARRRAGQTVRNRPVPVAAGALALVSAAATALLAQRRAAKARAAKKRAAARSWSALVSAAATALLARRRADRARTARTRAAAGPWFRRPPARARSRRTFTV